MEFGQRIKDARVQRKLTQDQVADKFFVTRQTISNWEKEKSYPNIASLIKISDYYHISLDTLLKEDTGMREYLEKKEITRSVKPVYNILLIVELGLFLVEMFGIYTNNNFDHLLGVLIMLQVLVSYGIVQLKKFDESKSLEIMPKFQKQINKYKYDIPIIPTLLILFGIVLLGFNIIAIGLGLIAIGSLSIIFVIRKTH